MDDDLEMCITLRDGRPRVVLRYRGVVVKAPMSHTYGLEASYEIFEAISSWIPAEVLAKHAPRGTDDVN